MLPTLLAERAAFVAFVASRTRSLSGAVAEELVQEAFEKAIRSEHELRDPASARAWFYGILRHAVTDAHRRAEVRERAHASVSAEADGTVAPPETTAPCRCIAAAVARLGAEQRDALVHVVAGDEALADFAERTKISNNHAAVRVYRAKKALASDVARTCGACAGDGCRDCTCAH